MAFGTIMGTLLVPVIFYTYTGILGYNIAIVDITIFYLCVITAFIVANKYATNCKMQPYDKLLNLMVISFAIAFIVFTIYTPNI